MATHISQLLMRSKKNSRLASKVCENSNKQLYGAAHFPPGGHITHVDDGADTVGMHLYDTILISWSFTSITERERRFLSKLRSDWLDEVMIDDNSPGTCEWVLYSGVFQAWLSGSEKVLWIEGNAGAGKTVLAKFLYRQLCDAFAEDGVSFGAHRPLWVSSASILTSKPRQVLAYFLDVNSPFRNNGLSVLHSLLYQILSTDQRLVRYVHSKPFFSQPQRGNLGQYTEVLSTILRDPSLKGTIIVLDALDECGPTSQLKIVDMLSNLADESSIQLLVTSRPIERITPKLMLDLSKSKDHVEIDIKRYVETAVGELAVKRDFSEDLRNVITKKILAHSSEGFLWVQLVLQRISKAKTARMIRLRLENLPQDLRRAYSDSLNRTTSSTDANLRRALYFVMIAQVQLQVKDLSALLALSHCWDHSCEEMIKKQPGWNDIVVTFNIRDITENRTINFEQDFRKYCQPLLSLNETSVSLVHYSLREFLEIPNEIGKFYNTFDFNYKYAQDLSGVHDIMAALCLQYMFAAFQGHEDPLAFLAFACLHWTEHARKAGESPSLHLEGLVKLLFSKEMDYASLWLSTIADGQAARVLLPLKADIAFVLAAFDLSSHFGRMLDVSIESLLSTDQKQRTPLHLAAANNSSRSVQWIQDVLSKADLEIGDLATKKDSNGESPITLAAQNGNEKIMRLLLVSIKSKYDFDSSLFKTIAVSGNRAMFETLYDYTNIKTSGQGMSLLTDAAVLDSVDLMERICSDHCGPTKQNVFQALYDSDGDPLLHVALRRQAYRVFNYLLDMGYSPAITDAFGNTALHIAAHEGNEREAAALIKRGVSVNSINDDGDSPLHIACKIGLPAMVRLLCNCKANVNLAGSSGCLPIHLAAETGQEELVKILLSYGINVNAIDKSGRSALHVAARAGQGSTFVALLTNGADVNPRDDEGRTPLHYAIQSGDLSLLYMLSEAGADLSAFDYSDISPLHLAAECGSEILVRELICLGVDPNPRDCDGRTPLHYSCLSKLSRVAVVEYLLEAGADVRAADRHGLSPLQYATKKDNPEIIRLLRENELPT